MKKNKLMTRGLCAVMAVLIMGQVVGCGSFDNASDITGEINWKNRHTEGVGATYNKSSNKKNKVTEKVYTFSIDESFKGTKIEDVDQETIDWFCAACALQLSSNGLDLNTLGGAKKGTSDVKWIKEGLEIGWGITDRQSALDTLNRLLLPDDKIINSWNSSRAMELLGMFYCVGYIEFDEFMEYAVPVGRIIQSTYTDWESFGNDYLEGYASWMRGRSNPNEEYITERYELQKNFLDLSKDARKGPYSVPFNLELK